MRVSHIPVVSAFYHASLLHYVRFKPRQDFMAHGTYSVQATGLIFDIVSLRTLEVGILINRSRRCHQWMVMEGIQSWYWYVYLCWEVSWCFCRYRGGGVSNRYVVRTGRLSDIGLNVTRAASYTYFYLILFHGAAAPSGPGPHHYRGFKITLRHATLGRTHLDEWSARRRDLYLTTQTVTGDRHPCPEGIRTQNASKRTAANPRLRKRGHCHSFMSPVFPLKQIES
jgi:hypothetical protein